VKITLIRKILTVQLDNQHTYTAANIINTWTFI